MPERFALAHDYLTQRGGAERVVATWSDAWPQAPLYTTLLDRSSTFASFATLKDRIASTHIHDNAGEKDDHLMPYDGGIDWDKTIRDFRTVDGQFPVLFELSDHGPEKTGLARLREVMEKLERIEPSSH